MIDPEFLERATKHCEPIAEELRKERCKRWNKWVKENKIKFKKMQEKYVNTDKGKYTISNRTARRYIRFKKSCVELSWSEKILIGQFYKNCPKGYEVDHIIPVSKGGLHILSNLQYLTKQENRRKSDKLNWKS